MKRLVMLVAATALVVGLVPASGSAAPPQQVVEGHIYLPAPFPNDTSACYAGLQRRISTATQNVANGVSGYVFDIDKATWNKNFVLEVTGGEGNVDLDLYMYINYPSIDQWPDDPTNAGTPFSIDFTTRAAGGEAGKVPPDTVRAIVCNYGVDQNAGFNVDFKYSAGAGVKAPKK